MPVTIASSTPTPKTITLTDANKLYLVVVNEDVEFVSFKPRTSDVKVIFGAAADGLVEGNVYSGDDHVELHPRTAWGFNSAALGSEERITEWWLVSATAGAKVEVIVEGSRQ